MAIVDSVFQDLWAGRHCDLAEAARTPHAHLWRLPSSAELTLSPSLRRACTLGQMVNRQEQKGVVTALTCSRHGLPFAQMNRSGDEEAGTSSASCFIRRSNYSTFDTQRRPPTALRLIRRRSVLVLGWRPPGGTLNSKRTAVLVFHRPSDPADWARGILCILRCLERLVHGFVYDHDAWCCKE
jgi:hypothetical protein